MLTGKEKAPKGLKKFGMVQCTWSPPTMCSHQFGLDEEKTFEMGYSSPKPWGMTFHR
jgi:hypothetical protein